MVCVSVIVVRVTPMSDEVLCRGSIFFIGGGCCCGMDWLVLCPVVMNRSFSAFTMSTGYV